MTDVRKHSRRHFLAGAGGALVAIPFLSSLLPKGTRADTSVQKRFVAIGTDHGGVYPMNFDPAFSTDVTDARFHPATARMPEHRVRAGALAAELRDGHAWLSACLQAPESALTPTLLSKMNVITGLSVPTYVGHNRGLFLGNYGANDQGTDLHGRQMATIDQLIARSPGFELVAPKERSFNFALDHAGSSSVRWAASADVVGGSVTAVPAESDPAKLWRRFFGGNQPGSEDPLAASDRLLVDRVHEHYRSLTTGAFGDAARLSSADRRRLELHMERLLELQRGLSVNIDCGSIARPTQAEGRARIRQAVDLAAAALTCGATHVAVLTFTARYLSDDVGWTNWHEEVAHNGGGDRLSHNPTYQRINYEAQRGAFRDVVVPLASALDTEEDSGETYLDRSLLMWVMESGATTHDNEIMPAVTFGGGAGAFHTGRRIDYANRANTIRSTEQRPETFPGVLYSQFLANVMTGLGVAPSEWAAEMQRVWPDEYADGARGYGAPFYHPQNFWAGLNLREQLWPWRYHEQADQALPFFANT